jgi:hypothetical protein
MTGFRVEGVLIDRGFSHSEEMDQSAIDFELINESALAARAAMPVIARMNPQRPNISPITSYGVPLGAAAAGMLLLSAVVFLNSSRDCQTYGKMYLAAAAGSLLFSLKCLASRHQSMLQQGVQPHTLYTFLRCVSVPFLTASAGFLADMVVSRIRLQPNLLHIAEGNF